MANEKLVTLDQLSIVKTYVDTADAKSIKSADYADNKISLYTTADKSGTAAIEIDLPEEMFLDQTKTTLVDEFAWSAAAYPGSADPSLDGKPVLVLAVKGDKTVNYSFIALDTIVKPYTGGTTDTADVAVADGAIKANIKLSAEEGNTLVKKSDGLYVAAPDEVSVSAVEGNVLENKADGLYVPTPDTEIDISAEAGNSLVKKTDGLFVPTTNVMENITFATNAEVEALFSVS